MKQLAQLDGLRTFALWSVLLQHFLPETNPLMKTFTWGVLGLYLFFVLSGYLITNILLNARASVEAGVNTHGYVLVNFHIRRWLRIVPAFYVSCILLAIFNIGPIRDGFLWHVSYLTNFYVLKMDDSGVAVRHFWSLDVEMQFYLFWPFLALFAPRKALVPALVALILFAPLYRLVLGALHTNLLMRIWLLPSNTDTLGMGALLAIFLKDPERYGGLHRKLCRYGTLLGAVLTFAVILGHATQWLTWGIEAAVIGTANALLFYGVMTGAIKGYGGIVGKVLSARPITYMGKISYTIYIIHPFVPEMLEKYLGRLGLSLPADDVLRMLVYVAVSTSIAAISWHVMERPLNDLKRYFPYKPKRPSIAQEAL